jgi:hypothetical protein
MMHSLSGVNQTAIKLGIPGSLIAQKICGTRMREVDIAVFDANTLHRRNSAQACAGKIPLRNYQLFKQDCQPRVIIWTSLPAK